MLFNTVIMLISCLESGYIYTYWKNYILKGTVHVGETNTVNNQFVFISSFARVALLLLAPYTMGILPLKLIVNVHP